METVARICYRHRRLVLGGWVLLLIGMWVVSNVVGSGFRTEFKLPGSESQSAQDILNSHGFGTRTGAQALIVFRSDQSATNGDVRSAIDNLLGQVQQGVKDASVVSPFTEAGARQISADGTTAYASINLADRPQEEYLKAADTIRGYRDKIAVNGLQIELGGDMFADQSMPASEAIGVGAAVIILLIAFGSVLAMGLPIVTALFGVGCGVALVGVTTRFLAVPSFATPTAAMLGIGVGIDYALLIVTRYRQSLHDGMDPESSVVLAMTTAGRSVLFAGITVVIAVLGMYFMNLDMIRAVATGAALSVLMTMLASLTLLPALLGFAGRKIDALGLPHKKTAEGSARQSLWYRWSRVIQRHPWPAAVGSAVLLIVLASPVVSMRLGFGDAGNRPTTDTSRRAYDLLSEGFGPGFNGPLVLAVLTPHGSADLSAIDSLGKTIQGLPSVAFVSPPQPSSDGQAAVMTVIPKTSPQDKATADLLHSLRDDVIPGAIGASGITVKVGGITGGSEDFATYTGDRMPVFFAAVLALSFLLLMVVFRSVLVPLKAVIMNLLSIGAAFGTMVAVFQWGWGASLVGVGKEGPIEAWAPMMLFAIVFGLSMDYEVFLLSRIREEYDRSGDNGAAVADGLAATARVITAAAAIMVCVFASFAIGDERALKLFGFGLAVAVFIDATVVRMVLVPATMELLGNLNWWIPAWLGRRLPRLQIEGPELTPAPSAD